ncbi:MAG: YibE/F family protein [Actinomycetota bacterium]
MHSHSKHSHSNSPEQRATPQARRLLLICTIPLVLATIAGFVLLRPTQVTSFSKAIELPTSLLDATIVGIAPSICGGLETGDLNCRQARARLTEGAQKGKTVSFETGADPVISRLKVGDKVVLSRIKNGPREFAYDFADRQRKTPMVILLLLFAAVVILLGRWRGFAALVGFGISLIILTGFVLPAILSGRNPLAVAVVGSAGIMFIALYLAHGINVRTTSAVLGTMASLAITGLLALLFVNLTHLTGFTSEEAIFINVASNKINLQGMLLGGIIIGSLGVLDDVTITQASAVWELRLANAALSRTELYKSALRIGRDHIASTVNTLVLAYAGASLPLLVLFTIASAKLTDVLTSEVVAQEIVRTLVGSIGLVASVPITTALAVLVVGGVHRASSDTQPEESHPVPGFWD